MKTLKFKWALPILAVAFAVSAAFASQKTNTESAVLEQGYVHSTQPCKKTIECHTDGLIQCTSGGNLVYAMDGSTGCDRPLYFN
jgi:hypothetical protein